MKKYILGLLSFVLVIALVLISGEIALRLYHYLKHINQSSQISLSMDEELGWLPVSNYVFNGDKTDAMGKSYPVTIQTNKDGFRIFGNPQESNKKKILFLGDSFTQAVEVSNSKTYYEILGDTLPIEVFAFGGGGYGTLQEYMILEKYIDEIRPDIIVIQFCSNDFINNHYELESRSSMNNNAMRRPYLTKNGIIYRLPQNYPAIRDFANKHSRILYFIISRMDRLSRKIHHTDSVENIIEEKGMSYPFFRESVEITEQLVKKIRLRVPSTTPVYAFSSDDSNPFYEELKRISENNEIYFIDGVPQSIRGAEQKGITTRAADHAHWNETGHQIVANVLKHHIEANW